MMALTVTLNAVKAALGITGTYQDTTIQAYFDDVIGYLRQAGVNDADITVGVVARGVSDLWDYGSGGTALSPFFKERAIQLAMKRS